jgi:benzylsuccinate CoA-transferase BbsE subunit
VTAVDGSVPPDSPLGPYRVLDLTGELGWLCGRILADFGADVVKLEPPGGDPGRQRPPCLDTPSGPISLAWLAHNAGKRSAIIDLDSEAGRADLLALVDGADFMIESYAPGHLDELGLGWQALAARNPRLVMSSITPFGQTGPKAQALASDIELMAAGGALWLAGDPDRPPVRITLPQAAAWTSMHAAMGTLIAHQHRLLSGLGQHVDVSGQEAVIHAISQAPMYWDMLRQNPGRGGPFLTARNVHGAPIRQIWPCRDGFVTFALYGGASGHASNKRLVEWMEEKAMCPPVMLEVDWDTFEIAEAAKDQVGRLEEAIAPFVLTLTRKEFFDGVLQRRILGYPVANAADISVDPQLESREVWQRLFDPQAGMELTYPTGYARFDGRPIRHRRPAPAPGEHQAEILSR